MQADVPVPVEVRELAEVTAREELLMAEEDPTARAERHVRQGVTERTVVILQEELRKRETEIAALEKKLRLRSTTLTRRLERNTMWTKVCCVLVVMALLGPTDKVAAFVTWILQNYSKGGTK
jgi:hypothetical protein